jgi:hypothetical protein
MQEIFNTLSTLGICHSIFAFYFLKPAQSTIIDLTVDASASLHLSSFAILAYVVHKFGIGEEVLIFFAVDKI